MTVLLEYFSCLLAIYEKHHNYYYWRYSAPLLSIMWRGEILVNLANRLPFANILPTMFSYQLSVFTLKSKIAKYFPHRSLEIRLFANIFPHRIIALYTVS